MIITIEINEDNSEKYKVKAIYDNEVYANKLDSGYLLSFFYLVYGKAILKSKILNRLLQ